jgi:hypothetical protein
VDAKGNVHHHQPIMLWGWNKLQPAWGAKCRLPKG